MRSYRCRRRPPAMHPPRLASEGRTAAYRRSPAGLGTGGAVPACESRWRLDFTHGGPKQSVAPDPGDTTVEFAKEGLTFDDVLLLPAESSVLPAEVDTSTRLTPRIDLAIPIVSAAMDTVTEAPLAIALAAPAASSVIHRNLSVDDQVAEVDKVKRSQSGMIVDPVTLPAEALVSDAGSDGPLPHLRACRSPARPASSWACSRTATCASSRRSTSRSPTSCAVPPGHGAAWHDPRGRQGHPLAPPHREAADRRRPGPAQGPHHRQGHQADGLSPRHAGREAGCGWVRRSVSAPMLWSGPSSWSTSAPTCWWSTCARPQPGRARRGEAGEGRLPVDVIAGNVATAKRSARSSVPVPTA